MWQAGPHPQPTGVVSSPCYPPLHWPLFPHRCAVQYFSRRWQSSQHIMVSRMLKSLFSIITMHSFHTLVCHWCLNNGLIDSPTELRTTELRTTELRMTELRMTELRTTELRMTQLQTTELRKTQLRKGLNFQKDPSSNWTSNLNFKKPYKAVFIWSESSNIGLVVLAFCRQNI